MADTNFDTLLNDLLKYVAKSNVADNVASELKKKPCQFSSAVSDAYSLLELSQLFPELVPVRSKSNDASVEARNRGNDAFVSRRNDIEALTFYSKAVALSVEDCEESAVAYANRSAVTFSLREYCHSVKDIDRALSSNYPEPLKLKLLERKGKCLMAMRKYRKATQVFNEMLQNKELQLDEDRLKRIKDLIAKCENGKDCETETTEDKVPPLTYPPSGYIQCASDALNIEYSDAMGRHVVAARDILPGDTIAVEKPYASVLCPNNYDLFCLTCIKRCHSLVPCRQCSQAMFCDEKCRDESWAANHSVECDILPTLINLGFNRMELLALRVLLTATDNGRSLHEFIEGPFGVEVPEKNWRERGMVDGKYLSDDYTSTHFLEMNESWRTINDLFQRSVKAACILRCLVECSSYFEPCSRRPCCQNNNQSPGRLSVCQKIVGGLLLRYLLSVPCNAHEVAEMRGWFVEGRMKTKSVEIGGALYPFFSLINHSCDPNVVRHAVNGDTIFLSAIQLIKKGDQIFDNYGYHFAVHDVETRQEHLLLQYYFQCRCQACLNNWPLYRELPTQIPIFISSGNETTVKKSSAKFRFLLEELLAGKTWFGGKLKFLCQHLTLLQLNVQRPWMEYNECQEVIKQCLSLESNHYIFKQAPPPETE